MLRCALAYGFRNIQTLLRKIKQGVCQYDYVEIMACPSGCINGGGQLKAGPGQTPQEVIARVEGVYKTAKVSSGAPEHSLSQVALSHLVISQAMHSCQHHEKFSRGTIQSREETS